MMFHIATALLAVLAIFNVASTLADDDFKVNYTVRPVGFAITDPRIVYGSGSGCGSDNKKCYCTLSATGELVMIGEGTSGTSTGLQFYCTFTIGESACSVEVDIPYVGTNQLRCICPGYTFYGCEIPDGSHNFKKPIALIPNDLQLDDPRDLQVNDPLCNSLAPSAATSTAWPSATPSASPSASPSATPSLAPSAWPSASPSASPSAAPSASPSASPAASSVSPTPLLPKCDCRCFSDDKQCKIKEKKCEKNPRSMEKCKKKCKKDKKKNRLCQMTCCKLGFV